MPLNVCFKSNMINMKHTSCFCTTISIFKSGLNAVTTANKKEMVYYPCRLTHHVTGTILNTNWMHSYNMFHSGYWIKAFWEWNCKIPKWAWFAHTKLEKRRLTLPKLVCICWHLTKSEIGNKCGNRSSVKCLFKLSRRLVMVLKCLWC